MKLKSPSSKPARRAGFTLLEVLIGAGLGVILLGAIMQAYFGANKAQALAIGTSALKVGGQKMLNEVYTVLHQNRHLFDRNSVTDTFLARTPIFPYQTSGAGMLSPGLPTPDPTVDLLLPEVADDGTFLDAPATGTPNPNFNAASAGNALFLATIEPQVVIDDGGGTVMTGAGLDEKYYLNAVRLHFYYLARRELPLKAPSVRIGSRYTYHLMHWKSRPYLDYGDTVKWMGKVMGSTDAGKSTFLDDKLALLSAAYAGALDLSAPSGSESIYDLTATSTPDHRDLVSNSTARYATDTFLGAIDFGMKSNYGEPMVAFNTTGADPLPVAGLDVPAYADDAATRPFGFEVMVVGRPDARKVLLRMALAARIMPGRNFVGQTFQQVVHVYEYGGFTPTPTPMPTTAGS